MLGIKLHNIFTKRRTAIPLVAALALFSLAPIIALALASFIPDTQTESGLSTIHDLSFSNYRQLFHAHRSGGFRWIWVFNSIYISGVTTTVVVGVSIFASYAATRHHYRSHPYMLRGVNLLKYSYLWAYVFPPIIMVIAYAGLFKWLGCVDTSSRTPTILSHIAFTYPFAQWLMNKYFSAMPEGLERAALCDGASWWQSLRHVIIPHAMPGIAAVASFVFVLSWNDVAFSIILGSTDTYTFSAAAKEKFFESDTHTRYSSFAAASMCVLLMVATVFSFIQIRLDCFLRRAK